MPIIDNTSLLDVVQTANWNPWMFNVVDVLNSNRRLSNLNKALQRLLHPFLQKIYGIASM